MTTIASTASFAGAQPSNSASATAARSPASGAVKNTVEALPRDPEPVSQRKNSMGNTGVAAELSAEQRREIAKLAARDREVRAHEAAHANVGGVYAGAPSYSYQRGPDGRNYAVSGEVSIDTSPVPGDPEATIAKARIVRRAALAPAQPSQQDRQVASEALAIEQNARRELLQQSPGVEPGDTEGPVSLTGLAPGSLLDTQA